MARRDAVTTEGRATLAERRDLTPELAIFRFLPEGGVPPFRAGQFLTLGAPIPEDGGAVAWRAFSIASPPSETRWLELCIRHALEPKPGRFTSELWKLPVGAVLPHRGIAGAFTVDDARPDGSPERRSLLFVAAGTGITPFVSCALDLEARAVPRRLVLVHGASRVPELAYDATLRALEARTAGAGPGAFRFRYVPTISRPAEPGNAGWTGEAGRAESLVTWPKDGGPCRLETLLGEEIVPEAWVAHACGHPGTVAAVRSELGARGFVERRERRDDGSFDLKFEAWV